jgi:hypothetical protein
MFGTCIGCGTKESFNCPLYLCEDEHGHIIACCIVFAINHRLTILRRIDDMEDWDSGNMWEE